MRMGRELGPKERALVHEMCEQLGLLHRSEGEGAERIIIVGKQRKKVQVQEGGEAEGDAEGDADANGMDKGVGFAELSVEDDDDDGQDDGQGGGDGNALLRQLAEERRLRRKAKEDGAGEEPPPPPVAAAKKNNNKKKKVRWRVSGAPILPYLTSLLILTTVAFSSLQKKKKAPTTLQDKQNAKNGQIELPDVGGGDDDDMAFLDAMVAQTQASHGRKVEGTGKGYKTIVNGILNARPAGSAVKKQGDARKSATLKQKLAEAAQGRSKKAKDKKK